MLHTRSNHICHTQLAFDARGSGARGRQSSVRQGVPMRRHTYRPCSACTQPVITFCKPSRTLLQILAASCTDNPTSRLGCSTPVGNMQSTLMNGYAYSTCKRCVNRGECDEEEKSTHGNRCTTCTSATSVNSPKACVRRSIPRYLERVCCHRLPALQTRAVSSATFMQRTLSTRQH